MNSQPSALQSFFFSLSFALYPLIRLFGRERRVGKSVHSAIGVSVHGAARWPYNMRSNQDAGASFLNGLNWRRNDDARRSPEGFFAWARPGSSLDRRRLPLPKLSAACPPRHTNVR
jgi:hypothetical protein